MSDGGVLVTIFAGVVVLTVLAPLLVSWLGARAGWILATGLGAAAVAVAARWSSVAHGEPITFEQPWIEPLGVAFALRVDALSLLFAVLVLAFGALVLAYCPAYVRGHVDRLGRFYTLMVAFSASMLGVVLADDVWLLYVCWEATTITSFLLIAHGRGERERSAALRALFITFAGGLALLAGLLVAAAGAGTFRLSAIVGGGLAGGSGTAAAVLALVVVAAAAKSAQFPLHVWLPEAMVAPTPVSAYLHSAAMVKAGVYLLARMAPLVEAQRWSGAVVVLGLVTAVFGGAAALRRDDLKDILAYSTISQLGLIVALLGVGTFAAVGAAMLHVVAHATYKAALFLVVGAVEHETGARDLRELSGLHRRMPAVTAVAALAVGSMAGLPPLLGYVSKEQALEGFEELHGLAGWSVGALAVVALALTVAYALRLFAGAFLGARTGERHRAVAGLVAPPAVMVLAAVALGAGAARLSDVTSTVAAAATGQAGHVEVGLWHGPTTAFWASVVATVLGVLLFASRAGRWSPLAWAAVSGADVVDAVARGVGAAGRALARPFERPVPAHHLTIIAVAALAAGGGGWLARDGTVSAPGWTSSPEEWVILGLLVVAVAGVTHVRGRLAALAMLGPVGFLVAVLFALHGAPDLVLTLLLVDALTIALIAFVFRQLPREYPQVATARRVGAGLVGAATGLAVTWAAYVLPSGRPSPTAEFYLETAPREGGDNVVNTILTDFRALDTVGEITVVAVAAIGAVSLIRAATRAVQR